MTDVSRRGFFAAVACSFVTRSASVITSPCRPPRQFFRFSYDTKTWSAIAPADIRPGDVIRVYDPDPHGMNLVIRVIRNAPDRRRLYSDYEIDPKTNQWVTPQEHL